jgi:hypothetical protein
MMRSLAVYFWFLVSACVTTRPVYVPDAATALVRYPIPAASPRGEVQLSSAGVVDLQLAEAAPPTRALHVRMIVANDADPSSWLVDTRSQLVSIDGEGQSRPSFANSDVGTLPSLSVARGERRTIDLYYTLPAALQNETLVPRFELDWQVTAGRELVAQQTTFAAEGADTSYASADVHLVLVPGWAPYWWYDPLYVRYTFVHPTVIHHAGPPRRVTVARPPRRVYIARPLRR